MSLRMILLTVFVIISLLYLIHTNQSATNGYIIKSLELEYDEYLTVSEVWNMRNAEARSMNKILNSGVIKSMAKPADISYLNE